MSRTNRPANPRRIALARARNIQRTLGTRTAAGFLRNQGISLDCAFIALLGRLPRNYHGA